MDTNKTVKQMALSLIEGLNTENTLKLIEKFETADNVLKQSPYSLSETLECSLETADYLVSQFESALKNAEKEFYYTTNSNIKVIFITDKEYPERLYFCHNAPKVLYVKGETNLNSAKIVSIVGTRKATEHGKRLCTKFIEDLAEFDKNIVIVSGLAFGIDITAHKAALETGLPTIGVMAGGFNHFYPALHLPYARKMVASNGSVITEQVSDVVPLPFTFVNRNRIIAGLGDATVVVESSVNGGSLITAKMAISYGREVYAFPGRVGERLSEGCNNFIKYNKAGLIENADDFIYFMGWNANGKGKDIAMDYLNMDINEKEIYEIIEKEKTLHHDSIIIKFSNPAILDSILLEMELKGIIERLPGNFFSLI